MNDKPQKPYPADATGKFNFHGGWSATQQQAFKELQYATKETFEFIADNKDKLIGMKYEEFLELNKAVHSNQAYYVYRKTQAMAQVFDAFVALGED